MSDIFATFAALYRLVFFHTVNGLKQQIKKLFRQNTTQN